jgi:hypothetical protein
MARVERAINTFLPLLFVSEAVLTGCSPKIKTEDPTIFPTRPTNTLTIEPLTFTPSYTSTLTPTATETSTPTLTATPTETPTPFEAFVEKCKNLDINQGYVGGIYAVGEKGNVMALFLKTGGDNDITTKSGEATLLTRANVIVILADFDIEGYKFDQIGNEIIYYIKPDGTLETYQVNGRDNYSDINGRRETFINSDGSLISASDLEKQYYDNGKNEAEVNKDRSILIFQTCIMGPPTDGYVIAASEKAPYVEIGITFTTAVLVDPTTIISTP